ncbi:MAG: sugar porter family MFS transporter [Actinomycetota bacterium]|nr:sugar porter family MFS transporter [Actinomycetota bacterium]
MTTESKAAEQPGGEGVLAGLDSQVTTSFYWYLAVLSCIGGFLFGYDTAVIGSVLDFIPYELSNLATGYLVAGASLGAAAGALAAGPLTDRFGRKSLLIVDAAIYAVGAILSAVAWNTETLLVARTLIGLAVGADSAIATAYIAEFAPRARRGALMIMQQWMITVGIFVSFIVAIVTFKIAPEEATGVDWRIILGIGALPAVVALLLRTRMPESPRWLMLNERYADTQQALGQLGMDVTEQQVRDTAEQLAGTERQLEHKTLWTPGVKRAMAVVGVFFVFQQITGINIPFYYGPQLLGEYFQAGKSAVDAAVAGVMAAAILGAVNVIATFFAFRYIDKIGRRKLAIGGFLGMAVSILVAAVGVEFLTGLPRVWVVMIGFSLFITAFAIGVGGTGWLIQGEVFPTAVRGRAAAACASLDWLANFVIVQWFPTLNAAWGLAWVMVLFAVLAILAAWFVAKFLPETKGLALEDVTAVFERQATGKESVA